MEILDAELDLFLLKLNDLEEFKSKLDSLKSIYPFSKYEYIISKLLTNNLL